MIWTNEEEIFLMNHWNNLTLKEIANHLNRTSSSILKKVKRLGIEENRDRNMLIKKKWLPEEDEYLKHNYRVIPIEDIMKTLDRNKGSIMKRSQYLKLSETIKRWSEEEENYLEENWGMLSIKSISKKLGRTEAAILLKANKLSLGEQIIANGYYLTPKDISEILNLNVRIIYDYIYKNSLTYKKIVIKKKTRYRISSNSFITFLENHKDKWDSRNADMQIIESYFSRYSIKNNKIGMSETIPTWLQQKKYNDIKSKIAKYKKWTREETNLLNSMIQLGYNYNQISQKLNRTISSIKSKVYTKKKRVYTFPSNTKAFCITAKQL